MGVMAQQSENPETTEKPKIENPRLVFVKGGTTTQKSEELYEHRFREAELRRDQADQDRKVSQVPIEQGGARLFTSQLTAHPEVPRAYVLLKYLDRAGSPIIVGGEPVQCCADIIVGMDPSNPTEITLMLVCPRCSQGAKHEQDCQIQIRQSNKSFQLTTGRGDPEFWFQGKMFKSAGMIMDCEKFTCPDCTWTAQIHENFVRPD